MFKPIQKLERNDTMTLCSEDSTEWRMCLIECEPTPCPTGDSLPEEFCFKYVRVANEIITGEVRDKDNNVAYLSGICAPFDHQPNVARMSFYFRAANNKGIQYKILLNGWGYDWNRDNPIFVGGFVVIQLENATDSAVKTNFDSGDTGTGTGMQAACSDQTQT
jgi:hypothetical protein